MMKRTNNNQRGAVLVVTLIMLSMITFLVVAFVGFSRFERASVEASLVRTEARHALEIGLVEAQREVMKFLGRELNHGLLVSQNRDGAGVGMAGFTNQASLVNFSKSLKDSPRVPVFIDRSGDGVQDTFPFFLDLNNALNADGSRYQQSGTNNLGRFMGDPHWIGLLQWPSQPHGPTNKFVARYAYLTVPAHKALNFRYHHNDLKRASANLDRYGRLQGVHPRELNLAAPLWGLDPVNFPYKNYNPYFGLTDPRFSSYPDPEKKNSAFGYAAGLSQFGHQIEDAMHLARSSKGYNELLGQNPGMASTHLVNVSFWLNSRNPSLGGGRLATPPYGYYQFMETFSSVPLPVETEKFDVNSIRDEFVYGTAYIDTSHPGLPLAFSGLSGLKFSEPHGLKSGDKLEWAGSPSGFGLPPMIYDPIRFDVILTDTQRQDQLEQLLTLGLLNTTVPHHLVPSEPVQINLSGIDGGLTWLQSVDRRGPYFPARDWLIFSEAPKPLQPSPTPVLTELRLETQDEIASPTPINNFWGSWDGDKWVPKYKARPALPNGDLPPEFENATCTLTYRAEPRLLDLIPYFVKVIDETRVSLHRSAQLDEFSMVTFHYPRSRFKYNRGVFTGVDQSARVFRNGNKVRFVIPNNPDGGPGKITTASGAAITEEDTFLLRKFGLVPLQFMLPDPANTSNPLNMKDGFTYTLQVVPMPKLHRFKHDELTAAMEKMAGLMLNESIDATGGAKVDKSGNLMAGPPVQHVLGGQILAQSNEVNPAVLELGLGGHQEAKGPWHHPKKGIPWVRGDNANLFPTDGLYTRELERIIQVSANIADLHSEYAGPNLPIAGSELLTCKSKGVELLPFGKFARDLSVSARIRQSGGYSGIVLCVRTDQRDYTKLPALEVRYVKSAGDRRAILQLRVWENGGAKPVASSIALPVVPPTDFYWLKVECEGGRKVKVSFEYDGERFDDVLNYEHPKTLAGQAALLAYAPGGTVTFTDLKPGVMPAALTGFPNWSFSGRTPGSILPTAWRGVFRRDENNYVYLTGFQRWKTLTVGRNQSASTSWYQRGAPMVVGVKDRGLVPGQNLAPAITEFSLRTVYDRETKALYGRLTAEVQAPGQNGVRYLSRFQAVIENATYTLVYRNKMGSEKAEMVQARPNVAFTGGNGVTIASPGSANIVMIPTEALQQRFAGLPNPNQSRFAQLTVAAIEISGADKNAGSLKGYSLIDIRVDNMTIQVEGEVHLSGGDQRTVDYINDRLTLSRPAHFANVDPAVNARHVAQFGTREWLWAPDWDVKDVYGFGRPFSGVVHKNTYWIFKGSRRGVGAGALAPYEGHPFWQRNLPMEMRKLDISWQVNDPLVNSRGSDFSDYTYAPNGYFLWWNDKDKRWGPDPNTPQLRRQWVPRGGVHFPLTQFTHQPDVRMGVNLAKRNDATRAWANGGDTTIQDPGVGYSPLPQLDWRFPDVARGRMENVGWLGQVHRGTPWQTLYLKSKVPGQAAVVAFNNVTGVVTAPNHKISRGDRVSLIGKCPAAWANLRLNPNAVKVDSAGNILTGELEGFAEPLDLNTFMIWPTAMLSSAGGVEILSQLGNAPDTRGLMIQNIAYWKRWAGSSDTLPAHDRRLLEVFSVGAGLPVRGRFSVNNDSAAAWSAALCGLSIPQWAVQLPGGQSKPQIRILGANDPDRSPDRDKRIDALDVGWRQIVAGINTARGPKVFTRVTDVLAAPQLSDGSPYLAVAFEHAPGFADELDSERIPQQLLSLLRVDDQPIYETYIFTEKLRPALRLSLAKYNGPAVSSDGTILNYEVAGQAVRRVIYQLTGAQAWHRSLKNNHPGYWRDKDGNLQPLPPLRPKILHSSTLQMN